MSNRSILKVKELFDHILSIKEVIICDNLHDLVPFVQFKKREKRPWKSVTFSKAAGFSLQKNNTPQWALFTSYKLYIWYQIARRIKYTILVKVPFSFLQFWLVLIFRETKFIYFQNQQKTTTSMSGILKILMWFLQKCICASV